MSELKKCPFCGGEAEIYHWYERFHVHCSKCLISTLSHPTKQKAIAAWNRRAQPENARAHARETGICPMCEDCPDGCPVETPNDSRNRPENEAIVHCAECEHYTPSPMGGKGCLIHFNGRTEIIPRNPTDFCSHGVRKPERSEG